MKFNVSYTNGGPRTPMGGTDNQTIAGLSSLQVIYQSVNSSPRKPKANDKYAAAVIQSNGENIGNAQLANNPLPPGVTA